MRWTTTGGSHPQGASRRGTAEREPPWLLRRESREGRPPPPPRPWPCRRPGVAAVGRDMPVPLGGKRRRLKASRFISQTVQDQLNIAQKRCLVRGHQQMARPSAPARIPGTTDTVCRSQRRRQVIVDDQRQLRISSPRARDIGGDQDLDPTRLSRCRRLDARILALVAVNHADLDAATSRAVARRDSGRAQLRPEHQVCPLSGCCRDVRQQRPLVVLRHVVDVVADGDRDEVFFGVTSTCRIASERRGKLCRCERYQTKQRLTLGRQHRQDTARGDRKPMSRSMRSASSQHQDLDAR